MIEDKGEEDALAVVKTVPGNHSTLQESGRDVGERIYGYRCRHST